MEQEFTSSFLLPPPIVAKTTSSTRLEAEHSSAASRAGPPAQITFAQRCFSAKRSFSTTVQKSIFLGSLPEKLKYKAFAHGKIALLVCELILKTTF